MRIAAFALAWLMVCPGLGLADTAADSEIKIARKQKSKKGGRRTSTGKQIIENEAVLADSSEANREGKEWDLVAELLGMSVAPLPSAGITAGYYLRGDMVAEFNYSRGSANIIFFEIFSNVYSLRLKKYWGNSFYTNSGIAAREIGAGFTLEPVTGSSLLDAETSVTSLVMDFAIGNKWQFENFTIGCDWIGAMIPVSKLSSKDEFETELADPDDLSEKEGDFDDLALTGTAQLLRFYLGASF